jgi:hypothetical protein
MTKHAVELLNEAGVVHGDLTADANIIVNVASNEFLSALKIIDFGEAQFIEAQFGNKVIIDNANKRGTILDGAVRNDFASILARATGGGATF